MKVIDTVNKTELDLTAEELVDLVANHNRQVDLIFAEPRTDEDGYLKWDHENWTCVDGKRFVRSYFLQGGPSATTAATTSTTWPATSCPRRPRRSGWDRPPRKVPFCC